MNKILEMRQKRAEVWDKAKAFLDERTNESGVMTAEDSQQYERMEQEVVDLGHTIDRMERAEQMDREMNERVSPNLASRPMRTQETLRGIASAEYRNAFWKHMRDIDRRSPEVRNALQVGTLSEGGYTVPDEFEHQLIQGLEDENIMRGLVHKITTSSGDRKIPLVTARGSASWIEEEAAIPESDDTFGQVTLGAHKVGCMIRVSEELLHDSLGAELGVTAVSAVAITADELIDLQHSVKSGYRRKGLWIMNDATLKLLRKLKDGQGNFIWQLGLLAGQPDTLLNQKVMISNYMPLPAAGNKAILYGDLSYYWLADREGRALQRLDELYAAQDQVGFKITQRVDGRLLLRESVKCLQMKAA